MKKSLNMTGQISSPAVTMAAKVLSRAGEAIMTNITGAGAEMGAGIVGETEFSGNNGGGLEGFCGAGYLREHYGKVYSRIVLEEYMPCYVDFFAPCFMYTFFIIGTL